MTDGIVRLFDLPENVYVKVEGSYLSHIFQLILSKTKTISNLIKETGIPRMQLYKMYNGKYVSLKVIKLLSVWIKKNIDNHFKKSEIEIHIDSIKTPYTGNEIFKPRFPMNFKNANGATIISAFLHDGCISRKFETSYGNTNKEARKALIRSLMKCVGRVYHNNSTKELKFPKILGIILVHGLKLPCGNKVDNNVKIPEFLQNGSEKMKRRFLKIVFDDEGCVDPHPTSHHVSMSLTSKENKPSNLLSGNKKLLEDVGIVVSGPYLVGTHITKTGLKRYHWQIKIEDYKSLKLFKEKINFYSSMKKELLESVLNSYKRIQLPKKELKKIVLKCFHEIESSTGFVTTNMLAEKLGKSKGWCRTLVKRFQSDGLIKVVEYETHTNYGSTPRKYVSNHTLLTL
ncbi:MAG: hypothetical protein QMD14_04285 [Candidatus Aenigmarchaeota archaeon]|nr:hypothetical protein [Candidatus Aenigmarchaeota archaeon]